MNNVLLYTIVTFLCYRVALIRYHAWVSVPPMSISEITLTVTGYSCSGDYIFSRGRNGMNNSVQLALREAESTKSSWLWRRTRIKLMCVHGQKLSISKRSQALQTVYDTVYESETIRRGYDICRSRTRPTRYDMVQQYVYGTISK